MYGGPDRSLLSMFYGSTSIFTSLVLELIPLTGIHEKEPWYEAKFYFTRLKQTSNLPCSQQYMSLNKQYSTKFLNYTFFPARTLAIYGS